MKPAKIVAIVVAGSALSATVSEAQGPPIHTDTPILLGLEGRGVRTFVKLTRRARPFVNGERVGSDGRGTTVLQVPIVAPFNLFSPKFQVGVIAPFARIDSGQAVSAGFGDARVFGKLLLFQRDGRNETFRIATKGGIKLPTGDSDARPPLGRDSTDYFVTTVVGWIRGRTGLYGEIIYDVNTSSDRVDLGDRVAYNLAWGYRLTPAVYGTYPARQLNLFLELNGSVTARSRMNQKPLDDSGGAIVFLSPGAQFVGGRNWLVEGSVQIPIVNRPNGTQLGTSWATLVGMRVLLF